MRRRSALLILYGLCTAGCDAGPAPDTVIVYASAAQETRLADRLSRFTDETRVPVKVIVGESAAQTDNVIKNRGTPPADVLLANTVADIWRAAERGALRPLSGDAVGRVPPVIRDPDRLWAALDVRYAILVVSPDVAIDSLDDYSDLARSEYRGSVCLTSAQLPVNRSLIGMLIADLGVKPAERMVRAWVRNLARPPYASEFDLVDAIRSGACRYGIVSSTMQTDGLSTIRPNPLYLDIDGIGVARHAHSAESAQTLVDWLLQDASLAVPDSSNGKNIGIAGGNDEDVGLLAERAGYR